MRSLKTWLIHKLGGITRAEQRSAISEVIAGEHNRARRFPAQYTDNKIEKLYATFVASPESVAAIGEENLRNNAAQQNKQQLFKELVDKGFIKFGDRDESFGRVYFATVTVCREGIYGDQD